MQTVRRGILIGSLVAGAIVVSCKINRYESPPGTALAAFKRALEQPLDKQVDEVEDKTAGNCGPFIEDEQAVPSLDKITQTTPQRYRSTVPMLSEADFLRFERFEERSIFPYRDVNVRLQERTHWQQVNERLRRC